MVPRGGMLMGMSRTVEGSVRSSEFLQISADGDVLVFRATPSNQEPAEFRSTELSDTRVVFANPGHDFPQRVIYEVRDGGKALDARVEGQMGGQLQGIDYPYRRVACAAAV
jgi:hypothetical protein